MNIWKSVNWKNSKEICETTRKGLRFRFQKDIDLEVKRACKENGVWLRDTYEFPKRVVIYFKSSDAIKAQDGDFVSGTFLGPYNKDEEPYIKVATGDYQDMIATHGKDNALASIIETIGHELTHYFQWLNDIEVDEARDERQAGMYGTKIMREYLQTREKVSVIMTKTEMKKLFSDSINPPNICRVYFKYAEYYIYYFPLKCNDKLFLGVKEDDFLLDGYEIRRFRDVTKIEIKDDKCLEISRLEGIIDKLVVPDVDITDWETIFNSLKTIGKNVIIKKENLDEYEVQFAIGRIESVHSKFIYFRHFDADGIWDDDLYKIPYTTITSVTFGSRYVDVFSKYLPII